MATSKLDRPSATPKSQQGARIEPDVYRAFDTEKAIGGWKLMRPEGRTVHVARPRGSKYFTDFVTKSAMTKASAALARLHQSRIG